MDAIKLRPYVHPTSYILPYTKLRNTEYWLTEYWLLIPDTKQYNSLYIHYPAEQLRLACEKQTVHAGKFTIDATEILQITDVGMIRCVDEGYTYDGRMPE